MIPARFHPEAAAEFDEAAQFYESAQAGLGRAFEQEVERAVDRISAIPGIGNSFGFEGPSSDCSKFSVLGRIPRIGVGDPYPRNCSSAASRRLMKIIRGIASVVTVLASVAIAAESTQLTDEASAIAAAKRYTKARCTKEKPCEFRARREGEQWNVMVEFSKRSNPREIAQRYPGGHVLLYFNQQGQLVRRVEGE